MKGERRRSLTRLQKDRSYRVCVKKMPKWPCILNPDHKNGIHASMLTWRNFRFQPSPFHLHPDKIPSPTAVSQYYVSKPSTNSLPGCPLRPPWPTNLTPLPRCDSPLNGESHAHFALEGTCTVHRAGAKSGQFAADTSLG